MQTLFELSTEDLLDVVVSDCTDTDARRILRDRLENVFADSYPRLIGSGIVLRTSLTALSGKTL